MIFFYIGYWFLTQRQSLGRSLLFVGSIELARIVFAGVLRSNIDPMFDDSRFLEMLAFNVGIFVPLALVFVCVVHFSGKLWKRLRSKKVEQATEEAKPIEAVPVAEKVVPDVQPIASTHQPEPGVTPQKLPESEVELEAARKLDGVMRLRIVATALVFLGCAGFAIENGSEYASSRAEANKVFNNNVRAVKDFEEDEELQEQCKNDVEYFEQNAPSYLTADFDEMMERWDEIAKLKRSLESIQSLLLKCGLPVIQIENCEDYRLFDDLYQSCKVRKRERDRLEAENKDKCASLEEQKAVIVAQIDIDDRYTEYMNRCKSPSTNLYFAREVAEEADQRLREQILSGVAFALSGPALFWALGSVIGWIVRGFRQ